MLGGLVGYRNEVDILDLCKLLNLIIHLTELGERVTWQHLRQDSKTFLESFGLMLGGS